MSQVGMIKRLMKRLRKPTYRDDDLIWEVESVEVARDWVTIVKELLPELIWSVTTGNRHLGAGPGILVSIHSGSRRGKSIFAVSVIVKDVLMNSVLEEMEE